MTSESRLLEYLFPQLLTSRHALVDYVVAGTIGAVDANIVFVIAYTDIAS